MERRSFLKVGVAGMALAAVGGAAALALRPGDRSVVPQRPLHVLSPGAFPVAVAVAARVLRETAGNPLVVAHRVDEALRFAPAHAKRDLDAVFGLLENGLAGLLLRGSATPFTLLDVAGQDAALRAWRDSDVAALRGAYHALRKLCLAAHYASADSFAEVGYPGPSLIKTAPPELAARAPLSVTEPTAEGMP